MIQLKDVIQYYIGQRFMYSSHHEPQDETYVLRASMLGETLEFGDRSLLRRLEDMTEEEALHIGKMAIFDRNMHYPDKDYKVWKPESVTVDKVSSCYAVKIDNDWFNTEIRIGFISGNIWIVNVVNGNRIYNQPQIFH